MTCVLLCCQFVTIVGVTDESILTEPSIRLIRSEGPLLVAWCTTFPRRLKRWTLRWNLLLGAAAYRSYTQSLRQNLQLLSPILVPCGPPDQDWYAEICIRSMMGLRPWWNKHLLWRHQRRKLNLILNQCVLSGLVWWPMASVPNCRISIVSTKGMKDLFPIRCEHILSD